METLRLVAVFSLILLGFGLAGAGLGWVLHQIWKAVFEPRQQERKLWMAVFTPRSGDTVDLGCLIAKNRDEAELAFEGRLENIWYRQGPRPVEERQGSLTVDLA